MTGDPEDLAERRRVLHVLERALELAGEERARLLDRECRGDARLRQDVDRLLQVAERQDELCPPVPGLVQRLEPLPVQLAPGTRLGGYELQRVIASGGMGIVYLATQRDPSRLVAVKVLRWMKESRAAVRRFRYEAEVLAHLSHPGIAQVYEAGVHREPDGREVPFFAMEYVDQARDVLSFVREERRTLEQRIEIFLEVCEAVRHAHQRGVIHRDLKPSNILIDGDGRAKVIDFGIARITGTELMQSGLETRPGQILGTLQYMGPEQLEASPDGIDTRSDLSSLGVILYQLLCEALPHEIEGKSLPAAARILSEQPARPARVHVPDLPSDLEAILRKALEKQPDLRYDSEAALANDLDRFLHLQPVQAKPPAPPIRCGCSRAAIARWSHPPPSRSRPSWPRRSSASAPLSSPGRPASRRTTSSRPRWWRGPRNQPRCARPRAFTSTCFSSSWTSRSTLPRNSSRWREPPRCGSR